MACTGSDKTGGGIGAEPHDLHNIKKRLVKGVVEQAASVVTSLMPPGNNPDILNVLAKQAGPKN